MASFKSHSVQAQICFRKMESKIELDSQDISTYSVSHDAFMFIPGSKIFEIAHEEKISEYFECILRTIKVNKIMCYKEPMAFLYATGFHYFLDNTTHPLIYYMSSLYPYKFLTNSLNSHALFEIWIDMYLQKTLNAKYSGADIFSNVKNTYVRTLMDIVYKKVYNYKEATKYYEAGIKILKALDSLFLDFLTNKYDKQTPEIMLNESKNFLDYTTFDYSYLDLFHISIDRSLEFVREVNKYLYNGENNLDSIVKSVSNENYNNKKLVRF